MEVFGWTPTDFDRVTPRFRAECLLYLSARSRYQRQHSADQKAAAEAKGRSPRRR